MDHGWYVISEETDNSVINSLSGSAVNWVKLKLNPTALISPAPAHGIGNRPRGVHRRRRAAAGTGGGGAACAAARNEMLLRSVSKCAPRVRTVAQAGARGATAARGRHAAAGVRDQVADGAHRGARPHVGIRHRRRAGESATAPCCRPAHRPSLGSPPTGQAAACACRGPGAGGRHGGAVPVARLPPRAAAQDQALALRRLRSRLRWHLGTPPPPANASAAFRPKRTCLDCTSERRCHVAQALARRPQPCLRRGHRCTRLATPDATAASKLAHAPVTWRV